MGNDQVEEIKNRLDIKEVVADYIKLEKSGINFRARCPFHKEKTPSFFVSPSRQLWRCFGCGEGGDIFSFIQDIEGVDFPEALRTLAKKAGVELKRQDPRVRSERARSLEICDVVAKYFHHQLESKNGKFVKEYFKNRGINEDTIEEFRLGYAPQSSRQLMAFLQKRGYKPAELEKAGIAYGGKYGDYIGRFRGRIMFPIRDASGNVIAFGGRMLTQDLSEKMGREHKEDTAKYINSPQTNIYDKSRTLYGLDKAKISIRQEDACVVAEGYTDVILAHQNGYKNVVAASGTALTEHQLKLINRFTDKIYTAFDMDIAGDTATRRGIDMAQSMEFDVRVITLPAETDPADMLQQDAKEWEKAVSGAKSVVQFYVDTALEKHDTSSAEGKRDIVRSVAPVLKNIASKVEQAHWVQELAQKISIEENVVWQDINRAKEERTVRPAEENKKEKPRVSRKELLAQHLLLYSLGSKKRSARAAKTVASNGGDLLPARLISAVGEAGGEEEKVLKNAENEEKKLLEQLLLEKEVRANSEDFNEDNFKTLLAEWEKLVLEEQKANLQSRIAQAESENTDTTELIKQLQEISNKRRKLDENKI